MSSKKPSKEVRKLIRKHFSYDPKTGFITWKLATSKSTKVGEIAGYEENNGYWRCKLTVDGKTYRFLGHILAWYLHYRKWPSGLLDHRNRKRSDNRIKNLRPATRFQNSANAKVSIRNKLGVKGVRSYYSRFMAQIEHKGKVYAKPFDTIEDASKWYKKMQRKFHPDFKVES